MFRTEAAVFQRSLPVVVPLLLIAAGVGRADEAVFSGPQPGEILPPLKVSLAYGQEAGQVVDLVEEAAGRPTLLVIVNGSNRPAAGLTRCLMNFAEMHPDELFAGVVYLAKDLTAAEQQLRAGISWWGMGPPVGVSVDGEEGPGSYGLNRNVNLTVLVADEGRVTANFALIQPSLADADDIFAALANRTGTRVPTQQELRFLSAPTRKPPNVPWQNAPADVELRKLICAALATANEDEARAAAAAVEQYVGDDPERQKDLGGAAHIVLQGYGGTGLRDIPIVKHFESWREKYDDRPRRSR